MLYWEGTCNAITLFVSLWLHYTLFDSHITEEVKCYSNQSQARQRVFLSLLKKKRISKLLIIYTVYNMWNCIKSNNLSNTCKCHMFSCCLQVCTIGCFGRAEQMSSNRKLFFQILFFIKFLRQNAFKSNIAPGFCWNKNYGQVLPSVKKGHCELATVRPLLLAVNQQLGAELKDWILSAGQIYFNYRISCCKTV